MVYIKKWTDFETAAADLYASSPNKVRYSVKFVPKTGQLVLKLTNDSTCIMYKSFSSIILNRFESLNLRLLSQIANVKPRARLLASDSARSGTPAGEDDDPMAGAGGDAPAPEKPATTQGGESGSGGGKKKKKKGKR